MKRAHILFVDDEEFFVKIWRGVMQKQGYKVTSYTSGLLALADFKAKPHSFDMVITDQCMPEISGCELAKKILKIRNDMKIIICTGYLDESDRKDALDNGVSEIIIKPFYVSTLIEAIERNLLLMTEHIDDVLGFLD